MNNIYIFKGDSTTFADVTKFLTFHIQTNLNLAQWKAEFSLGSVIKTVEDISSKSFEIILSKEDTEGLLYGLKYGALKLIDDKGQIKTVANKLPFMITNEVIENENEIIDLTIPKSTAIDISVEVGQKGGGGGGTTDYKDLYNKPQINGVELVGNKTLKDLGIQSSGDYATTTELTSGLAKKQNVGDYALRSELPTKTSELQNDSNFLTSIPAEYITETELNLKDFATNEKLNSTDDEVNFLTDEVSDVKQTLLNKLEVGNIIQGDNITLNKVGNNITINGKPATFTTEQQQALDSGITSELVTKYDNYKSAIDLKLSRTGGSLSGGINYYKTSYATKQNDNQWSSLFMGGAKDTPDDGAFLKLAGANEATLKGQAQIGAGNAQHTSLITLKPDGTLTQTNDSGTPINLVKSVNGKKADEAGNVTIEAGGGGVIVKPIPPDETGMDLVYLENNTILVGEEVKNIWLEKPSNIGLDFIAELNFKSGATATKITDGIASVWYGDDVENAGSFGATFTPKPNTHYAIMFYLDGSFMRAIVQARRE